MSPTFLRAASTADLAIIEGQFHRSAVRCCSSSAVPVDKTLGGNLDTLSDWLDLPRLAIVDVAGLSNCHLPPRPAADALLLDGFTDETDFHRWQTNLESLWGIKVLGGLDQCAEIRQHISALPIGQKPLRDWCRQLSQRFLARTSLKEILSLAARRGIPEDWPPLTVDIGASLPARQSSLGCRF